MKNSLSELERLPIAVGNVLVTGLLDKRTETYSCVDLLNKVTFFIQVPKGYSLAIGKIYSVLGRASNIVVDGKTHVMVYTYKITKRKVLYDKSFKVFLPKGNLSLVSEDNSSKVRTFLYDSLIVSTKETEVIKLLTHTKSNIALEEQSLDGNKYLEAVIVKDTITPKRKQDNKGKATHTNSLYLSPIECTFDDLSWISKKFQIEHK